MRISPAQLWGWLLGPSFAVVSANFFINWLAKRFDDGVFWVLPGGLIAICLGTIFFAALMKKRYRGGTRALLVAGYFFGQMVVCLAAWIGSCVVIMS